MHQEPHHLDKETAGGHDGGDKQYVAPCQLPQEGPVGASLVHESHPWAAITARGDVEGSGGPGPGQELVEPQSVVRS